MQPRKPTGWGESEVMMPSADLKAITLIGGLCHRQSEDQQTISQSIVRLEVSLTNCPKIEENNSCPSPVWGKQHLDSDASSIT